ncbi:MAG: TetR/AcrR family transcriptional regulator [Alkalispirochaeta sp.]
MAKEHAERREEIIATAHRLFFSLGYDTCTINDIIMDIGIAKGTFYHYFRGKQELLEALIEQLSHQILDRINAIAGDTSRSAADRLSHYFQESMVLKAQTPELMVAALNTMYRPENTLLRVRMFESSNAQVAPVLGSLIRQGTEGGEFWVDDPELCGEYIIRSFTTLSDKAARMILDDEHQGTDTTGTIRAEYHRLFDFMEWAIARLLGVEPGSITLTDRDVADDFFDALKQHRTTQRETQS